MPGSRRSEIRHILPVMLKAAANVAKVYPNAQWILPLAPGISRDLITKCQQELVSIRVPPIKIVEKSTYPAMRASTLLLVTSGTATLEAACIGTPMIILFRTAALNWHIIRSLSPLDRSGLPNLIAGHDIVPELLQTDSDTNGFDGIGARFFAESGETGDTTEGTSSGLCATRHSGCC